MDALRKTDGRWGPKRTQLHRLSNPATKIIVQRIRRAWCSPTLRPGCRAPCRPCAPEQEQRERRPRRLRVIHTTRAKPNNTIVPFPGVQGAAIVSATVCFERSRILVAQSFRAKRGLSQTAAIGSYGLRQL